MIAVFSAAAAAAVFHREISTVMSVKNISAGFYMMDCTYNYNLDKLLQTGVAADQELIDYIAGNLLRGMVKPNINVEDFACTTFNAKQKNGDYIFARNFDYMPAPCMLMRTDPDDGYASISMVNLEFAGYSFDYLPDSSIDSIMTLAAPFLPVDGMNEKGLCIGVLELENGPTNQDTGKIDLTTTTMIRLVLDRAATVDEAINLFKSYDMHDSAGAGYHYQITDANGASVILEHINNELILNYPEHRTNNIDYQTAANYYVNKSVIDPKGFGQERCAKVMAALDTAAGIIEIKEAMTLLSTVSMNDEADPNGYVCDTLWSAVYNSNALTVSLCTGLDYSTVHEFSLFDKAVTK